MALQLTTQALQRIHERATDIMSDTHDVDTYGQVLTGIASLCSDVLGRVDYGHLIHMTPSQDSMASTFTAAATSTSQSQRDIVVLQPRQQRRRMRQEPHLHDQDDKKYHENL
ncbi:unnamed protein product [Cuscuta epithymum]|uniref:Uncharacterized protein n=1 Tax=Cuscuta epithymum TaxID=186058 RepID=A0AAV0DY28_9ASTE|nr:unnamed protein product [Cuscuta epithymum]